MNRRYIYYNHLYSTVLIVWDPLNVLMLHSEWSHSPPPFIHFESLFSCFVFLCGHVASLCVFSVTQTCFSLCDTDEFSCTCSSPVNIRVIVQLKQRRRRRWRNLRHLPSNAQWRDLWPLLSLLRCVWQRVSWDQMLCWSLQTSLSF